MAYIWIRNHARGSFQLPNFATASDWTTVEFILAIGALAALFWVAVVFLRGGLLGGSLIVLLAGICFGHPFFNLPLGPLPLTSDRVLLVLLLAQYVVYRRWGWTDPKPLTKTDYLLGAFLTVLLVSTFTHSFAANRAEPVSHLICFYLMPAAIYWVARQTKLTEQGASWLFGALAVFGGYLCLTAIAETHQAWAFVFPRYIGSPEYAAFLGRGRGPFLNPAGNGIAQGLGLCAALMWWPRLNRRGQLVLLATLPIFFWGIYSTYTRCAWLGGGLGLFAIVALTIPRNWRVPVISSVLLSAILGVAIGWEHVLAFKRDKDLDAESAAESVKLRPILAIVAWHMFLDRPLLGCGYGQYVQESPAYLADRSTEFALENARPYVQHNVFLGLLTETGLLGMGFFIALMASWARTAWQLWRNLSAPLWVRKMGLLFLALLGVYLPNAMFQDVSIIAMVNMMLFFLAGTTCSLTPWLASAHATERLKFWPAEVELAMGSR